MAVKEISMDATLATVSSELDGTFTREEKQKNGSESFSMWKTLFCFDPTGFGMSLVKGCLT